MLCIVASVVSTVQARRRQIDREAKRACFGLAHRPCRRQFAGLEVKADPAVRAGIVRRQRAVAHGFDGEDPRPLVVRGPFQRVFDGRRRVDRVADEQDRRLRRAAKRPGVPPFSAHRPAGAVCLGRGVRISFVFGEVGT